jgi:diguanylate cyclase (GGDEF)-like protein
MLLRIWLALILVIVGYVLTLLLNINGYSNMAYDARKNELQHIVDIAKNTIQPLVENQKAGLITKEESIQEGIEILSRMTFQDSYGKNYIFMTNYEGTMLVIPYQMEKRGLNQWNLQDINGKYLIQEIIKIAKSKEGEGFVDYYYLPPGRDVQQNKISYIVGIPEWDAYIGTGMYTEDLERYNQKSISIIILIAILSSIIIILSNIILVRPLYLCHRILLSLFEDIRNNPDNTPEVDLHGFNIKSEAGKLLSSFRSMLNEVLLLKKEKEAAQTATLKEVKKSEQLKSKFLENAEKMVRERTAELTKAQAELEKLSRIDALTSLYNRRVFDETYEREFSLAKRTKNNLSLLIVDVDHFKKFNDRYGHQKGDECLQAISSCMQKHVQRMTDTLTRYGGEEFAIIMSDTDTKDSLIIAEKIRSEVEGLSILHEGSSYNKVTVSMGVSTLLEGMIVSHAQLFDKADKALYKAKKTGRNKIITCS